MPAAGIAGLVGQYRQRCASGTLNNRGGTYFVTVSDSMRKASNGKRTLDNLLLAMLERRKQGRKLSVSD